MIFHHWTKYFKKYWISYFTLHTSTPPLIGNLGFKKKFLWDFFKTFFSTIWERSVQKIYILGKVSVIIKNLKRPLVQFFLNLYWVHEHWIPFTVRVWFKRFFRFDLYFFFPLKLNILLLNFGWVWFGFLIDSGFWPRVIRCFPFLFLEDVVKFVIWGFVFNLEIYFWFKR